MRYCKKNKRLIRSIIIDEFDAVRIDKKYYPGVPSISLDIIT